MGGAEPLGVWGSFTACLLFIKYVCPINIVLNFTGKHCGQRESAMSGAHLDPQTVIPANTHADSPCLNLTLGQQRLENK